MATASAVNTNAFTPSSVPVTTPTWNLTSAIGDSNGGTDQGKVANFLRDRNYANPPFNTSTSGRQIPGMPGRMVRGYIRRSAPDSGDASSQAILNFMYNPPEIVREYVSYLDQAALDPFNTVYQSGNLVAPPSFVNFSFSLMFDRQIEEANGSLKRGVMEDYDFFDLVVRNVAPGGGTSAVPDNGVMMVNPKDISVVFSPELTVQGRPTNASVRFTKFSHTMIPIRMEVSLTMIITYFGPMRDSFTLDASQQISKYEALIPYSAVYSEQFTQADSDAAKKKYKDLQASSEKMFTDAAAASSAMNAAYTTGSGVTAVGAVGNSSIAGKTLATAVDLVKNGPAYTQGGGRRSLPASGDCSGMVGVAYQRCGVGQLLTGEATGTGNCASMLSYIKGKNFTTMQMVCNPQQTDEATLRKVVQPGDIFLRVGTGKSNHIGFVNSFDSSGWNATHQTSPRGGTMHYSISYLKQYNYILRPAGAGGQASTGGSW